MALPTALFAMVASFGLASAAVLVHDRRPAGYEARPRLQGSDRRRRRRRQRRPAAAKPVPRASRPPRPASGPAGEAQQTTAPTAGARPRRRTVGGASYSYRVSAYTGRHRQAQCGRGRDSGAVSRRIEVGLDLRTSGENVFAERAADRPGRDRARTAIDNQNPTSGPTGASERQRQICGQRRTSAAISATGVGKSAPDTEQCTAANTEGEKISSPGDRSPIEHRDEQLQLPLGRNCTTNRPRQHTNVRVGQQYAKKQTRPSTEPWDPHKDDQLRKCDPDAWAGRDYFVCRPHRTTAN